MNKETEMNLSFEELKPYIHSEKHPVFLDCRITPEGNIAIVCKGDKRVLVCAQKSAIDELDYFYAKLKSHVGHNVECTQYGKGEDIWNIAIECLDCQDVIFSLDNPAFEELMGA